VSNDSRHDLRSNSVPSWFGIPEANAANVAFVDTHDTWIAHSAEQEPIGFISGQLHFPRRPRSRSWRSARSGIAEVSVERSSTRSRHTTDHCAAVTCGLPRPRQRTTVVAVLAFSGVDPAIGGTLSVVARAFWDA